MSSYLQGSTYPDTSMLGHQYAQFSNKLMLSHDYATCQLAKYLSIISESGIVYTPNPELGIQCYVVADFAGRWNKADADNLENVMSRTRFVIMYTGCPVLRQNKMHTEIALSTAKAEYISLSSAIREVISFMQLLTELSQAFDLDIPKPE
eukprot:1320079-Ditylum_brightwellii.AAC.1